MIAVDTNILVYAHRLDMEFHRRASAAIAGLAESSNIWAIPWPCLHEFLAVVTNTRAFHVPTHMSTALGQVELWMESPSLRVIGEEYGYWDTLSDVIEEGKIAGGRVHDARIAAICKLHGVSELWSADRDFSRVRGIRVVNPLIAN